MKVICIRTTFTGDNFTLRLVLSINKSYDVIETFVYDKDGSSEFVYTIRNDIGDRISISSGYFITLDEYRDNIINQII